MGEVIELGATVREVLKTAAPLRQPVMHPASQWVSLETLLGNLLWKLEQRMSENGITKP